MPFDRFTVEQIAGDMLPSPTTDQMIASGFHRNAMTNEEGGIDPEEARYEVLVDRVNTTATVWLGHDARLRAVPQPQVRSLHAEGLLPDDGVLPEQRLRRRARSATAPAISKPSIDVPTPEQEAKRKTIQAEIDKLNERVEG